MTAIRTGAVAVRAVWGLLIPVLIITSAGCSDNKLLTIQGSVSYKGQPLSAGIVKFYGPGDSTSMAYVRDGDFIVTDLPPGEYKVSVEPDTSAKGGKPLKIPSKYADPNTSGFVFPITGKNRELSINLD
jgi:hypothetical protein